ncbi:hypothetical protein OOT00_13595 [Desulfobotulus sp. H1]|uniref:Uncharacterized protein n=1 Tax=Desulfobotulus pelophilus TaxID=2823377 RepID=A0ABT3NC24_9BACT|nr:hypothetical protein [Desulfobotulus pelophilus]MCW7755020.1 hypothetical protein [Desulfobotulus pelophilus]
MQQDSSFYQKFLRILDPLCTAPGTSAWRTEKAINAAMAKSLYEIQDKALRHAMACTGLPFEANRDAWMPLIREITSSWSTIDLSDLTLGQRWQMIHHFKMADTYNPTIPLHLWHWKK